MVGATPAMEAAPAPADNTFLVREVRIFDGVRVTGTGSVLVAGGWFCPRELTADVRVL